MGGAGFGRLLAQPFGRVARHRQAPLRVRQGEVGRDLLLAEPRDRLARFELPGIETGDLFPDAADLGGHELAVLLDPELVRGGALALAFDADNGLFLPMKLRRQPRDGRGRVRNGLLEPRRLVDQLLEGGARVGDLLAQLLDFALGGEDASRLALVAAGDDVAPAEDVAFERGHRIRHRRRNPRRRFERLRDQRAAHHGLDGIGERTADAHHRRQRHSAGRNRRRTLHADAPSNPREDPRRTTVKNRPCGTSVRTSVGTSV